MTKTMQQQVSTANRELVFSRLINAPQELVFKVWTEPEHVAQWWGPDGFTNTILEMNVQPGGLWRLIMYGPDGTAYPNRIVYKEVVKPERLVYMHGADTENDPGQFETTVTFEKQGNKTLLTMRAVFASAAELEKVVKNYGAIEGNKQTLNRMELYLSSMQYPNKMNRH